ncbi:hypothetical protein APHAL10511_003808 [Amanita phalloides]|nr:hypothetical protein APHAL10511_003808 [Amanita phalloides]
MLLVQRSLFLLHSQHARHASQRAPGSILEQMADMVSRLAALESPAASDPSKPADLSGPKPNALRNNPQEEPIPPLPSPLRGYPTPWVTEYEVLSYVYPLYTRGWGQSLKLWKPPPPKVKPGNENNGLSNPENVVERYTMLLSARYRFKDYNSAVSFFLRLARLAKTENHHPSVHIANGSPVTVTVTSQTDSARRPTWVEEQLSSSTPEPAPSPIPTASSPAPSTPESSPPTAAPQPLSSPAPRKIPGITLRDVRLAILTETIYTTDFSSHLADLGRHIHPANFRLPWSTMERIWKRQIFLPKQETARRERRRLWVAQIVRRKQDARTEKTMRTLRRRAYVHGETLAIKCFACGGSHHVNDCPKRENVVPLGPCPYCKEMHWSADCPVRNARYIHLNQFQPDIMQ